MARSVEEFETDPETTEAERALISACREGKRCLLNDGDLPADGAEGPKVRAELIRLLAVEATSLHEQGVWLEGAVIMGELDLSFARCRGSLVLDNCRFAQKPQMAQADLAQLSFDGSHLPGLFAQGVKVTGSVFLRAVTATGTVAVNSAQIGGQLACNGATLDGAGDKALNAQGAKVTQGLFLRDVTAKGTVAVNSAQIGGQLDCTRATLDGAGGKALYGQSLRVEDGFLFRGLQAVTGMVDLTSAHARNLVDDAESWGKCRNLNLYGFAYERISGSTSLKTFASRKEWLEKGSFIMGVFYPQPYNQFASAMRTAGHMTEVAKTITVRTRSRVIART